MSALRALWHHRSSILSMTTADIRGRYLGSVLGALWLVIHPAVMIAVYILVFSAILGARLPTSVGGEFSYGLYLCAGVLPWGLFHETVARGQGLFTEYGALMKNSRLSSTVPLASMLLSAAFNFVLPFLILLGILLALDAFPGWSLLGLVPVFLVQQALAGGLGILLGVANVLIRDFGQATPVILQLWFWGTPIVYPPTILPEATRGWIELLNPMYVVMENYHAILVYQAKPDWAGLVAVAVLGAVLLLVARAALRRTREELVDML